MKLILISGIKLCKLVEKRDFKKIRQSDSHIRYVHSDGRKTTIPVHGNEEIGGGLLREILKQIKLSREEYNKLRRKV